MLIFFSIVNLNIAVIFDLAVQKGFQLQTTEVHVPGISIGCYGLFKKKNCIKGSACVHKNALKYEIHT